MFLLGSAYTRFYCRPSWLSTYFGLGELKAEWLRSFDEFARAQQIRDENTFFARQPRKAPIP